jgi:hypothetical protein
MMPTVEPKALGKTKPWEFLVRFAFGGAVTAATGLIAHELGPSIGGLFLAFPAILPASLTLVKQHYGRAQAVDDARGACLGSIGLAVFALFASRVALHSSAPLVLVGATLLWAVSSVAAWTVVYGRSSAPIAPRIRLPGSGRG